MGSAHSKKPEITIRAIRISTEDIRNSLRRKQIQPQNKESLYHTLIDNSKQLETLRAKRTKKKQLEIDQLQKMVSDVSEELLEYNDRHLDKGADESNSFIQVDPIRMKKDRKTTSREKLTSKTTLNHVDKELNQIEFKLSKVKNDVNLGVKNNDNQLLVVQKRKIEVLSTDLELLNILATSENHSRKENLEKDLYKYYQRIIKWEKRKTRVGEMSNVDHGQLDMNTTKLKALEIMVKDIEDVVQNFMKGDNRGDFVELKKELKKVEMQLNETDDKDENNIKLKTELLKKITQINKCLNELEIKDEMNKLDELMDEIDKKKLQTENNKTHGKETNLKDLQALKDQLQNFEVKHNENIVFKNEYLSELSEFLDKMDPNHDGVIMRKKVVKGSKSVEDLLSLQKEWSSLEKNISMTKLEEVKRVDSLLSKFEESIKAKRRSIANLLNTPKNTKESVRTSDEIIKTNVKIFDLPKIQKPDFHEKCQEKPEKSKESSLKYGSIEYALQEITDVSDRIEELAGEITKFQGMSEDLEYNFLKASLIDKKEIIENLSQRSSWTQVSSFRNKILKRIDHLDKQLESKLRQNVLEENIKQKLNELDMRTKRFTGSHENILYKHLEAEIQSCMKAAEQIEVGENREGILRRVKYLKNMLRERSTADSTLKQDENLTDSKKIIAENEEYISKLKNRIVNNSTLQEAEYSVIEDCLLMKTMELINLNLKNDTPMFQEVKRLLEEIEDCRDVLKKRRHEMKLAQSKKLLEEIERRLIEIQGSIADFDGLESDEEFIQLNESLNEIEADLSKIERDNSNDNKILGFSLRTNFHRSKLQEIALKSEKMFDIEMKLKKLLEMVSTGLSEGDFEKMDEELINLKIELEKFEVNEKLSYRKITCLSYIEYLMKKVTEIHNAKYVSKSIIV